jgi:pimeloyl-ACP methyl ester carboxylesterase
MHPETQTPIEDKDQAPSRRTVLSGIGLAAAGAMTAVPASGAAAAAPAGPGPTAPGLMSPVNVTYWNRDYVAMKGDVKLQLYRRRLKAPVPGEAPLPVLFLVHGSSMAGKSSWDLQVPKHPDAGEYSMMNVFARYGYDVWVIDFEGYGKSSRTSGNSDIKSGVADLAAASPLIARETGAQKFHFIGSSSGALRVAAFAIAHPGRVDRAVLGAFTYTGKGSPTLEDRAKDLAFYQTHNTRPRPRSMLASIFTRDMPGTGDPRVAEALADIELPHGDSVPTGTYLDMTSKLPLFEAKDVKCPVLVIRGEYDGIATEADLLEFYSQLPNPDRQFITLAATAHNLGLSWNRHMYWHAVHSFLNLPKPIVVV